VSIGTPTIDGHHPQGDLKKVSQGSVTAYSRWDSTTSPTQYLQVQWSSGTTEGGSSGSGLLTLAGTQYVLRGGLRGGTALCSNLDGFDLFSRFDQIYPSISQYLGTSTGARRHSVHQRDLALVGAERIGLGPQPHPPQRIEHRLRDLVHLRRGWQAHLVRDALRQLVLEQHV
jgi:hypothetical protein